MQKVLVFIFGLIMGFLGAIAIGERLGLLGIVESDTQRALAARLELIPTEKICTSIASGEQILGNDHVTVWADSKRYLLVGWQVERSGIPIFYWTGADLPVDVAGCKKEP